jgi:glutamate carboxypeptidase
VALTLPGTVTEVGAPSDEVDTETEAAVAEMVDDVALLVGTESPSLDVEALTRSAGVLGDLLERRLGRPPTFVDGPAGPHVQWSAGGDPKVLLLGHHDTVFPLGTLAGRPFTCAAGRMTGPGVFDMKTGIVQAIHAVAALDDRSGVEILLTSDEEVGSTTSRALVEARAVACGAVLVLEPSADGGALKTGRKGTGTFEVVVRGRASHAGLEPEQGVNALVEASRQVLAIAALGDPATGTTVTPTMATAGTADNVVPAEARIRVDVRVLDAGEKDRIEGWFDRLTPVDPACSIEVFGAIGRPPMPEAASATLFPIARSVDPGITGVPVGGGSDGNFTAALGVPTLDGLGAVGGGAHADHEYVEIATLRGRVALLTGILRHLLALPGPPT